MNDQELAELKERLSEEYTQFTWSQLKNTARILVDEVIRLREFEAVARSNVFLIPPSEESEEDKNSKVLVIDDPYDSKNPPDPAETMKWFESVLETRIQEEPKSESSGEGALNRLLKAMEDGTWPASTDSPKQKEKKLPRGGWF